MLTQQIDITHGVEHNHRLAATDVLGDQQFCQARLRPMFVPMIRTMSDDINVANEGKNDVAIPQV